ncbi:MAG: hypothetical protein C4582_14160 [Desulfobacteraceae bacterium]|jgi:hydroxymethylpyrimidine pyrophosphatase-like HAD family hydrolase|nr:MAG: hypothetical protein C4582_14160 [Desulfobacteraceae bacterium]
MIVKYYALRGNDMALKLEIPGKGIVKLTKIVLDLNGTLTVDGKLHEKTLSLLNKAADILEVYILTADTLGSAIQIGQEINVNVQIVSGESTSAAKADFVELSCTTLWRAYALPLNVSRFNLIFRPAFSGHFNFLIAGFGSNKKSVLNVLNMRTINRKRWVNCYAAVRYCC